MDRKETLLRFLEKDPASPFLLFALAKEYETEGNLSASLETYEQLLQADPRYTGAYYHLGKLYERLESPDKAKEVYEHGLVLCRQQKAWHDANELQGALNDLLPPDELG
ncbi:MAG TPA: tetratricopeptide repeat protein [Saprospiraceae bacterium]|nr:tetratricopeptide repeat protein [Saprospiraceae bacterium]HNT19590.1 tetratricopeptide repeat protein [Saprospiraceae bacterium]